MEREGALSAWSALTLEGGAIQAVGVPPGAKFYAYAFPLSGVAQLPTDELDAFTRRCFAFGTGGGSGSPGEHDPELAPHSQPELAFVLNGGLVFANDAFQTIGLGALCGEAGGGGGDGAGGVLQLDGPHPVDPTTRERLAASHHCARPTSVSLRQAGVASHTWVEPREGLAGADGDDWCTGALVFM